MTKESYGWTQQTNQHGADQRSLQHQQPGSLGGAGSYFSELMLLCVPTFNQQFWLCVLKALYLISLLCLIIHPSTEHRCLEAPALPPPSTCSIGRSSNSETYWGLTGTATLRSRAQKQQQHHPQQIFFTRTSGISISLLRMQLVHSALRVVLQDVGTIPMHSGSSRRPAMGTFGSPPWNSNLVWQGQSPLAVKSRYICKKGYECSHFITLFSYLRPQRFNMLKLWKELCSALKGSWVLGVRTALWSPHVIPLSKGQSSSVWHTELTTEWLEVKQHFQETYIFYYYACHF